MSASAFELGAEAYREALPMSACPYPEDSIGAIEWEGAWIEAEENDTDTADD